MPSQLTPVSVSTLPTDQRTCAICQETLGGRGSGQSVKTHCNHVFDSNCIQQWLDTDHSTCPICREEIGRVRGGEGGLGGSARARFRSFNRGVRRAREHENEEREQMRQAQSDYGDTHMNYEDAHPRASDGHNLRIWEGMFGNAHELASPQFRNLYSAIENGSTRNFSPERSRYHRSRSRGNQSEDEILRAFSDYSHALTHIQATDRAFLQQAQVVARVSDAHQQAELKIQDAFGLLTNAARTHDRYVIGNALAIHDSVTTVFEEVSRALQFEDQVLMGIIERREDADRSLTRAREDFSRRSEPFLQRIREDVQDGGIIELMR